MSPRHIEREVKMKYQKHYLSDDKSNKLCPLSRLEHSCDSYCAWFDHEEQDCRKILALQNIVYEMRKNTLKEEFENDREFKF